jgi:cardiolipin synthase A/B
MDVFIAIVCTFVATALLWLFATNVSTGEKKITKPLRVEFGISDEQFARVMGGLLGPALVPGNRVKALYNGEEIFPAMLAAIDKATCCINFETYIYWSGDIGKRFSDALSKKARNGIEVHVLLDWAGSCRIDHKYLSEMKQSGVEVERFHPIRWYTLARINNRTHRKLMIVDGKIGFTGGVGIADKWTGHAQNKDHWRDTHFQIEGPAVTQMQAAFVDNWTKVRGCVLHDERYFPKLEPDGPSLAQVFKSSRDEGSESVRLMYLLSIAAARECIHLSASYFVPDDLAVQTFVEARERGVKVEIVVPGPLIDSSVVRRASRARWGKLLEAGVAIYEYQPTMFHCKVLIVDNRWVSVGSTNFDNRSFRLNAEANLNILDPDFAAQQVRRFEEDKSRSHQITLDAYRRRPMKERATEQVSEWLRSQL